MNHSIEFASKFFTTNVNALSSKLIGMSNDLTEQQKMADTEIVICNSFSRLHDTADLSSANIALLSAAVVYVNTAIYIGDLDIAKLVATKFNSDSVRYADNFIVSDFDVNDPEGSLNVYFDISMSAL